MGWGWAKEGNAWLPYWKIRNSWGPLWGENGYARVVRGVNEMAIERVAVAANVLLYIGNKAVFPLPHVRTADESKANGRISLNAKAEASGSLPLNTSKKIDPQGVIEMAGLLDSAAETNFTQKFNFRSIKRH